MVGRRCKRWGETVGAPTLRQAQGERLYTINSIAVRTMNTPAICLKRLKISTQHCQSTAYCPNALHRAPPSYQQHLATLALADQRGGAVLNSLAASRVQ